VTRQIFSLCIFCLRLHDNNVDDDTTSCADDVVVLVVFIVVAELVVVEPAVLVMRLTWPNRRPRAGGPDQTGHSLQPVRTINICEPRRSPRDAPRIERWGGAFGVERPPTARPFNALA